MTGNKTLVWTIAVDYPGFDCPAWLGLLATTMGMPVGDLRVCTLQRGSAIVGVASTVALQDRVLTGVADGSLVVPGVTSVLDTSTGRSSECN